MNIRLTLIQIWNDKIHTMSDLINNFLFDVFSVANLVGGTIVIPHTRRALEYWEELELAAGS